MALQPRPDVYARVHRGLRQSLFNLSVLIGKTDFLRDGEIAAVREAANETIRFLHEHGNVEDRIALPLLEKHLPGATAHDSREHVGIEKEIATIDAAIDRIAAMPAGAERVAEGEELYHCYNRFLADYLRHMDEEERVTMPLFWQHCSDDELKGMTAEIMATTPPEDLRMMLGYMIPAMNHTVRVGFYRAVQAGAPPDVFNGLMGIAAAKLSEREYAELLVEMEGKSLATA